MLMTVSPGVHIFQESVHMLVSSIKYVEYIVGPAAMDTLLLNLKASNYDMKTVSTLNDTLEAYCNVCLLFGYDSKKVGYLRI